MEKQNNIPRRRFPEFTDPWEQYKYSEIIDLLSGQDFAPNEYNDVQSGIPYLTGASCIENGRTIENRWTETPKCLVEKNDVIMVCKGSGCGAIAIVDQEKAHIARQFMALKAKKEVLLTQFNYWLLASVVENIKTDARGLIVGIARDAVLQQKVSIPTVKEQKKIGICFNHLDSLILLQQRKLDQIKEYKKGMLQKMFPKDGETVPEIRFPGFEEEWKKKKLGELLEEFSIKSKTENEFPVLSSTNIGMENRSGRVSGQSNKGYKIIKNGDLVLSPQNLWLGNININDIGEGIVSPSYKTFRIIDLDISFFKPQIRLPNMLDEYKNASSQGASVVRRNLDIDAFYQISIYVPSLEEQSLIGNYFKSLDSLITLHQRKLDQMKEYKKGLLQQMFV